MIQHIPIVVHYSVEEWICFTPFELLFIGKPFVHHVAVVMNPFINFKSTWSTAIGLELPLTEFEYARCLVYDALGVLEATLYEVLSQLFKCSAYSPGGADDDFEFRNEVADVVEVEHSSGVEQLFVFLPSIYDKDAVDVEKQQFTHHYNIKKPPLSERLSVLRKLN